VRREPGLVEDGGENAMRELAKLGKRGQHLLNRTGKQCRQFLVTVRLGCRVGEAKLVRGRQETLLGAVVQIPLEVASRGIRSGHDAGA
jgi:hypothetical protein